MNPVCNHLVQLLKVSITCHPLFIDCNVLGFLCRREFGIRWCKPRSIIWRRCMEWIGTVKWTIESNKWSIGQFIELFSNERYVPSPIDILWRAIANLLFKVEGNDSDATMTSPGNNSLQLKSTFHQKSLLFRAGFFRLVRNDGDTVLAQCLRCDTENVKAGNGTSNSNFLAHLKVCTSWISWVYNINHPFCDIKFSLLLIHSESIRQHTLSIINSRMKIWSSM